MNITKFSGARSHIFIVLLVMITSTSARSQQSTVEEIIVTANKLGTSSLQDLPNVVSVITGEELTARGALDFVDFAGSVPGLQFQDLGPGDKEYIIRGVNSSGPSTVGLYFDEAVITGSNAQDGGGRNPDIKLIDMQAVEVLNGPQGTQYGANSMSGVIRYVTNKPEADEFSGRVEVDYSVTEDGDDNKGINGTLNIPIVEDVFAARVSVWSVDNTGWIDQSRSIGGPRTDVNDEDTTGARVMFRYTPNDRLTLDFMYLDQDTESDGSSRYTPNGLATFGNTDAGFPATVATTDYENTDLTRSPWQDEMDLLSLTGSYEFDAGTLTGTVNKFSRDILFNFDSSPILFFFGVPIPGVTVEPQEREILSSEIRFASSLDGPVQYLIGAFNQQEDTDFAVNVVTSLDNGLPAPFVAGPDNNALGAPGGTTFFGRFVTGELKQSAFFGELSYDISEDLVLTVGARHFKSDLDAVEGTLHDFGSAAASGPFTNGDSDSKTTAKINLSYQPTDTLNVFGTLSQGFRVGGLNNANISFSEGIPQSFSSDELLNTELGIKTQLSDSTSVQAAIYQITWDDIQVGVLDVESGIPFTANAGEAEIKGLELSLDTSLSENLSFQLALTLVNAELTEDQPFVDEGEDRGFTGDKIPNIPDVQGFAALTYEVDTSVGLFSLRGDLSYRDAVDIRFDTSSEFNRRLDSYTLLNLRGSLEMEDDWLVTLYAKNLSDEIAEYDAIASVQDPLSTVGARPRTIGVSLSKSF